MQVTITDEPGLRALLAGELPHSASRTYSINFPTLSAEENELFQGRLNTHASACGCGSAATFSMLAVVIYLYGVFQAGIESSGGLLRVVLVTIAVFILSGAFGKLAGLLYSRWRLNRNLQALLIKVRMAE
jgi:hypothetical protein